MAEDDDGVFANIRDGNLLGPFIGQRVVDITQHDHEEWEEARQAYVELHFESGATLKFYIDEQGFDINNTEIRVVP